jgi:hypothetical protein
MNIKDIVTYAFVYFIVNYLGVETRRLTHPHPLPDIDTEHQYPRIPTNTPIP